MRQIFSLRLVSTILSSKMRSHTYIDSFGSARIMAQILDGKALSATIKNELKIKIANWVSLGNRPPSLRCIIVGDDPASHTYVNNKIAAAAFVGINAETIKRSSNITEEELIAEIQELNADSNVDGILVQLPVPDSMNERRVCNTVAPEKDVDGFHIVNVGQLCLDMPTIVPATALAVVEMLKRFNIETFGRNAVVIGRSKNVGMPIAMMLHSDHRHDSGLGMDATVTICHRHTPADKLAYYCRNADIIITATGLPKLIKADMVKPGATIVDVGISRITDENGKTRLVGDVDYDEVSKIAGAITPVPGGVGPMTVTMLMHNTFQAAQNLRDKSLQRQDNLERLVVTGKVKVKGRVEEALSDGRIRYPINLEIPISAALQVTDSINTRFTKGVAILSNEGTMEEEKDMELTTLILLRGAY